MNKVRSGTGTLRMSALAELGRLGDPDLIREVAHKLCESRPATTKAGIARIRDIRRGAREANPTELANSLVRCVNDYWKRFPKLTPEQIRTAFNNALGELEGR
jgi:hypothetical protein